MTQLTLHLGFLKTEVKGETAMSEQWNELKEQVSEAKKEAREERVKATEHLTDKIKAESRSKNIEEDRDRISELLKVERETTTQLRGELSSERQGRTAEKSKLEGQITSLDSSLVDIKKTLSEVEDNLTAAHEQRDQYQSDHAAMTGSRNNWRVLIMGIMYEIDRWEIAEDGFDLDAAFTLVQSVTISSPSLLLLETIDNETGENDVYFLTVYLWALLVTHKEIPFGSIGQLVVRLQNTESIIVAILYHGSRHFCLHKDGGETAETIFAVVYLKDTLERYGRWPALDVTFEPTTKLATLLNDESFADCEALRARLSSLDEIIETRHGSFILDGRWLIVLHSNDVIVIRPGRFAVEQIGGRYHIAFNDDGHSYTSAVDTAMRDKRLAFFRAWKEPIQRMRDGNVDFKKLDPYPRDD